MDLSIERELQDIISNGDLQKLIHLLKNGLNPDTRIDTDTLLIKAIKYRNITLVKLLVENGANIIKKDLFGRTPRVLAKELKVRDIEKYLLKMQFLN